MRRPKTTTIHRESSNSRKIDPRIKLILLLGLVAVILVLPNSHTIGFCGIILFITVLIFASKLPLITLLKRISAIIPLFLLFFFLQLLFHHQDLYQQHTFLSYLFIRTSLILTALTLFFHTTPFPLFIKSLAALRMPSLVLNVYFFTHNFMFLMLKEGEILLRAWRSRTTGRESLKMKIKGAAILVRQLMLNILQRSDNLYVSMLSRGYRNHIPFISLKPIYLFDYLTLFSILLFYGVIIILP